MVVLDLFILWIMRKRFLSILLIFLLIFFLVDLYVFYTLRQYIFHEKWVFPIAYWFFTLAFLIFLGYVFKFRLWASKNPRHQKTLYNFMGLLISLFIPKLFSAIFFIINDLVELFLPSVSLFFWSGLIIGIVVLLLIVYGILSGKFHFKVERRNLFFENLPEVCDGLRILHFSDLHIGSWTGNHSKLEKAVEIMNAQNPDIMLFTGDLVNNFAEELNVFMPILKKLKAKYGIYSILGNHDYGDYFYWNSEDEKTENLRKLKNAHKSLGFNLLMNNSDILVKNNSNIGIIGVENWGLPPFHQNGDLQKAIDTIEQPTDFNILLSHDPSHWKQKVIQRNDIDLTLSGHTHGMQFGFYTQNLKWSPAKWKYPEWGGLYEKGKQKLYVSTGLGFIGFPGRIGVRPRITILELRKKTENQKE